MNNEKPDIRSIEAFAAVVRYGSMTAAAQKMSVGQPAITRMIRELENRVGFALFERNGPKIAPSAKGLMFFEESQRVMANLLHLTERAHAIRDDKLPAIDIVATPTMSAGLVGPVLARIQSLLPDFVHIETTTSERVMLSLRQCTADLGFSAYSKDVPGLECLARFESRVVALVKEGSPYDTDAPLPLSVFAKERLATITSGYQIRSEIDKAFETAGIKPVAEIAATASLSAAMAARAGLGIALCDPVTAAGIPIEGLSMRPLETEISYDWALFARADSSLKDRYPQMVQACCDESALIVSRVDRVYGV